MMMARAPYFNFNSTLSATTDILEAHNLLEKACCIYSPDSTFSDTAVLSSKLYPTLVCGEASAAEGGCGSGSSSASPSEEAELSQRGRRRSRGRSRGGRGRRNETKHLLYKGVRKRQEGRWVSEIREPGKKSRIWLGTFPTPEMAARAYDVAVFNLKRPYAYVNFPEAVSSLPVPQSCSPKHIQEAASIAAAAFRGAASSSHVGRSGGLVSTSQVGETSNLPSTSSSMPEQHLHPQSKSPEQQFLSQSTSPEQQVLHPQSTSLPTTTASFLDEDLIFDMPNVLTDMAEGLMIMPPLLHHGTQDGDNNFINNNGDNDDSLWDL